MNDSPSFLQDTLNYAGRIRQFERDDWLYYVRWVGLMLGLLFSTAGFVLTGWAHGVQFPAYVWNVPLGTAIFIGAISLRYDWAPDSLQRSAQKW